jgi:hypothetical protein
MKLKTSIFDGDRTNCQKGTGNVVNSKGSEQKTGRKYRVSDLVLWHNSAEQAFSAFETRLSFG